MNGELPKNENKSKKNIENNLNKKRYVQEKFLLKIQKFLI